MTKFIITFLFISNLFSDSITLLNDNICPLTVRIYDAEGALEGEITLAPNQTHIWHSSQSPFKESPAKSYTPYSVHWICPSRQSQTQAHDKKQYENEYGVWDNVAPGSLITARGCPHGTKTCAKEKKEEQKPAHNIEKTRPIKKDQKSKNIKPKDQKSTFDK